MEEIKFCYTCKEWKSTTIWKGKCPLHPEKRGYNTDVTVGDCTDYDDKYAKYKVASREA